jgi:hypothetical protein
VKTLRKAIPMGAAIALIGGLALAQEVDPLEPLKSELKCFPVADLRKQEMIPIFIGGTDNKKLVYTVWVDRADNWILTTAAVDAPNFVCPLFRGTGTLTLLPKRLGTPV